MLNRKLHYTVAAFGALAFSSELYAAKKPNIIWIVPDQMRAQAMGCMGNPDVRTPNIDRLAGEGVLFRNMITNTPICCPARAVLLTGKYSHTHGLRANDLRLRESEISLAEVLKDNGYRTGFIGKWHLDGGPRQPGFVPPGPRRQGFDFWAAHECRHSHFQPVYFRDTSAPIVEKRFEPEVGTDLAIEFLQKQDQANPFFLVMMMGPPHDTYGAPQKYMDMYDPNKLTMRPNWNPRPGRMDVITTGGAVGRQQVPDCGREVITAYYAAITAIDEQVGRLLKELHDRKLDQDTIVVFISDHGDMLGSHGLRHKRQPYEESINVPGIIRWTSHIKPAVVESVFSLVDVAPTMLGLARVIVPSQMQGINEADLLLERGPAKRDAALLQIFSPEAREGLPSAWRGIRTRDYMYARSESKPWVFFDLREDPFELTNLAQSPEHAAVREKLDGQLLKMMRDQGDSWTYNTSVEVDSGRQLYSTKTFHSIEEYLEWSRTNTPDNRTTTTEETSE